jgi:outer membrane receptor protein involved in Fe transport
MRGKLFLMAGVCMAAVTQPVFAQDATDDGDKPIIVTATLREANVQDIPIAVTAVAPEALERQGVRDIKNIASISPSINIQSSQTESQGTTIRIRGVGTTGNNIGLESSVGVFIDGVYQSRPGVALGDLVDLERLEILRGPQGTLFGRNTSAGALNITTKRPDLDEFEGFMNMSYGNYNFFNVQGGVSVPIAPGKAAVRVSGAYRTRDGFIKSLGGPESNDRNRYLFRGQFYAEPSTDLSVRIIADYTDADEHCCEGLSVYEAPLSAAYAAYGLPNDGVLVSGKTAIDKLQGSVDDEYANSQKQWGLSGEIVWNPGTVKVTSITAYRDYKARSTQDDFSNLRVYRVGPGVNFAQNAPKNGDDIKTFTQELRVQGSAFNDKLDWLIGGFYSNEKIKERQYLTLGPDYQANASVYLFSALPGGFLPIPGLNTLNPLLALTAIGNGSFGTPGNLATFTPGALASANGNFADSVYKQDSESWSIFTHNVLSVTDKLSVTLGARYVKETKDGSFDQLAANSPACQAIANGLLNGNFTAFGLGGLGGPALALTCFPFTTSVNLTVPGTGGTVLASNFLPLPREFSRTFKDDELTYTAQLGYKPTENSLVYASFSHGFKSGGFNLDSTAAAGGADPRFKSEKVDAYELGAKMTFGRVNVNLAAFHMNLKDFQVLEFTGVQFVTFNVDKAKSTGAELEIFGRIVPHLTGNFAVTYADSRYPNDCVSAAYKAANPTLTPTLLCGAPLTNAPKWSGVAGLTYDGPLSDGGPNLLVNVNAQYSDKRRTSTAPKNAAGVPLILDYQPSYVKINARVGLSTANDRIGVEFWATNLTNKHTRSITYNTPLRPADRGSFFDEPRMYGVTVRAAF